MRAALFSLALLPFTALSKDVAFDVRSAKSGPWSDPATWEGRAPKAGDSVQVRTGHSVTYDANGQAPVRVLHVAGTLDFSRTASTLLEVGLLKIAAGETCDEEGFDCHAPAAAAGTTKAALIVGTRDNPIPAGVTATIRLRQFEGMNPETLPAIVACGGGMDFHGAGMRRTWLKLAATAKAGDSRVTLESAPDGWKAGDRLIVTGGKQLEYRTRAKAGRGGEFIGTTEEATIVKIDGSGIELDRPLAHEHMGEGGMRCEVANLSRNVVVESAEPDGVRGHTMYHRGSSGSIGYAEFRNLGKRGQLGKYPIHFHMVRDSMRGSTVIGASIWNSDNHWIAIHGTDHLLVRDCVGYRSRGHGFYLEDGTEEWNVLDRNLAVQAIRGPRMRGAALSFDTNDGGGFWWANGRNTLVRNVSCENSRYGFRFETGEERESETAPAPEVAHVPFLRFEDNESHTEGLYSFRFGNEGEGTARGDRRHPFIVRNLRAWETHYAMRPDLQFFLCEGLQVKNAAYGVYHPDYNAHVYRDIRLDNIKAEPINRGHDDKSIQYGDFTYERVTIENCSPGRDPLIQLACTAPKAGVSGHFRDIEIVNSTASRGKVVDLGGGPRNPNLEHPVTYYFHEGGGIRRVVSAKFPGAIPDGKPVPEWTGRGVLGADVEGVEFPSLLSPVDDLAPTTTVTGIRRESGRVLVSGLATDNNAVAKVLVNGAEASITSQTLGIAQWTAELADGPLSIRSLDAEGNEEAAKTLAAP